jgi:hypothetical protein
MQRFFMPEIQLVTLSSAREPANSHPMKQIKQFPGYGL